MKRLPVKRDESPARPITFRAAEDLGPFELAQLWADRTAWPLDERTQYDELSELAVMSALAAWLRRCQPVAIHGAILAGASPEAVATALGETVEVTFARWQEWALRQRDFIVAGKPGITLDEYEMVTRKCNATLHGSVALLTAHAEPTQTSGESEHLRPSTGHELPPDGAADLEYELEEAVEYGVSRLPPVWLVGPHRRPDHKRADDHGEYKQEHENEQTGCRGEALSHRMLKPLSLRMLGGEGRLRGLVTGD